MKGLKEITRFAKRKKISQGDFIIAIIEFLYENEERISIVDGRIEYKENVIKM